MRLGTDRRGDHGPFEKSARPTMHESDPGSRVPPTHVPPPGGVGESAGPHTLQILMTEHWSLLAHRGFLYTESLGRTSIFVAALTGSVVALALVAQATDVGDSFVAFALVLLPVVYFLGVVTFVRLLQVNWGGHAVGAGHEPHPPRVPRPRAGASIRTSLRVSTTTTWGFSSRPLPCGSGRRRPRCS